MGRAKLTMTYIQNERARKIAFMQRRKGLMKKISNFSTIYGADETCLIVYDGDHNVGPVTWPQDPKVVRSVLEKYEHQKEKPPKTFHVKDYFENKKKMVEAEISKVQKEILNIKYPTWDPCFRDMGEEQLWAFIAMLDAKIGVFNHRINLLKNMQQSESNVNLMQSMAHESVTSSHPSQLNVMQNLSQSQHIPAPNQVDASPDSTNQLGEPMEWADPLDEFMDWANHLAEIDDDFVEWASQNIPFQWKNK